MINYIEEKGSNVFISYNPNNLDYIFRVGDYLDYRNEDIGRINFKVVENTIHTDMQFVIAKLLSKRKIHSEILLSLLGNDVTLVTNEEEIKQLRESENYC